MATAAPSVTINILGDGSNLQSALNQTLSSLNGFTNKAANVDKGGGLFASLASNLRSALGPLAAIAATYATLGAAKDFAVGGIKVNSDVENTQGSIATIMGQFGDDRSFADRMESAGTVLDMLREKGKTAAASFNQMSEALGRTAGNAAQAGFTKFEDQIDLIAASSKVLDAYKGDQANLGAEMQRLLTGTLEKSDKLNIIFGQHTEELKKQIAAGTASKFIMEKMAFAVKDADASASSFATLLSTLGDTWEQFQGEVMQPIFDVMKPGMEFITQKLNEAIDIVQTLKLMFKQVFEAEGIQGVINILADGLYVAFGEGVNVLFAGIQGVMYAMATAVENIFGAVVKPEFWLGLGNVFVGLVSMLVGGIGIVHQKLRVGMMEAIAPMMERLLSGVIMVGYMLSLAFEQAGLVLQTIFLTAAEILLKAIQPLANMVGMGQAVSSAREGILDQQVKNIKELQRSQSDSSKLFEAPKGELSGWEKAQNLAKKYVEYRKDAEHENLKTMQQIATAGKEVMMEGADQLKPFAGAAVSEMGDAFKKGYGDSREEDIINTTEQQKKLADAYTKAAEAKKKADEAAKNAKVKELKPEAPKNTSTKDDTHADSMQQIGGGGNFAGSDKLTGGRKGGFGFTNESAISDYFGGNGPLANSTSRTSNYGPKKFGFSSDSSVDAFLNGTEASPTVTGYTDNSVEKTPEEKQEERSISLIGLTTEIRDILKTIEANTAKASGGGLTVTKA